MAAVSPADRVRDYCRQAGIHQDNPLFTALVTVAETTEAVREAALEARQAAGGARGLTPQGETDLVDRIGSKVAIALRERTELAVQDMRRRALWSSAAIIVGVSLALGGGGYYFGRADGATSVEYTATGLHEAFQAGPEGAAVWLRLMRANNPAAALAACKAAPITSAAGTRRACWLPMWLDASPISPPQ